MRYILSDNFKPFQILTYMWVHANFAHLFSNMFAVLVFAPILEKVWGSKKFFIFYLITGIGAGILYCAVNFYETYEYEKKTENWLKLMILYGLKPLPKLHGKRKIPHSSKLLLTKLLFKEEASANVHPDGL